MAKASAVGKELRSPLVPGGAARFVSSVPAAWIIAQYRQQFDIDVAECFDGVTEVDIYECLDTSFRFYYPESIAGKDLFYRRLAQYPWFYQQNKWEHGVALDLIESGQRVLDVGCGTGHFLKAARQRKAVVVTGIELNQEAAATAKEQQIEVVGKLIEEHASERPEFYDVVTAFQVLEHVPKPRDFLLACLNVLKTGGLFVIGVPNNGGFLRFDRTAILNGPPHHMGLWTRKSLSALTRLFPMDLVQVEVEPLNVLDWYQSVMEHRYLSKRWVRSLFYRLGGSKLFRQYLVENAETIAGHTIMVVYRKRAASQQVV